MLADLVASHWDDAPTVAPSYWTVPPASARFLRAQADRGRVFGLGVLSAGEPGYAVRPLRFEPARDTLAWSLPPVWGLRSSGGATPIISNRLVCYDEAANRARVRFDLEGVTHVLAGTSSTSGRFASSAHVGMSYILPNPTALPRARLMAQPVYAADARAAEQALRALGTTARERLIVEDPTRPLAAGATATGSARIVRDVPERVEVEVEAAAPSYLFLADTFDPGWSATCDGRPVPIRPAYVAFRAVFTPAGRHRVVFRYAPAGFAPGLAASGLGALLCLGLWFWPRRAAPWHRRTHRPRGRAGGPGPGWRRPCCSLPFPPSASVRTATSACNRAGTSASTALPGAPRSRPSSRPSTLVPRTPCE